MADDFKTGLGKRWDPMPPPSHKQSESSSDFSIISDVLNDIWEWRNRGGLSYSMRMKPWYEQSPKEIAMGFVMPGTMKIAKGGTLAVKDELGKVFKAAGDDYLHADIFVRYMDEITGDVARGYMKGNKFIPLDKEPSLNKELARITKNLLNK